MLLQLEHCLKFSIKQLYQFPNATFHDIENIAVRSNGQLLLNMITEPSIYYLDPRKGNSTAQLLYTFPNATSLVGIAEYAPDQFAIAVGNYTVKTKVSVRVLSPSGPSTFDLPLLPLSRRSQPSLKQQPSTA